ncbi:MAPK/MAK/MRK overlapping kinase-like [Antedon mediterranea]|uniref:MAPK/MAK/MRK overlapping kinase-like n=1 Tax=Antedon mediterranea TaxID=105859 RepID=UPI003AF702F0
MLETIQNPAMHKYRVLGKKGEGTFSEVLKCQNTQDGTYYACKKMKQTYESLDQVNGLREIQAMRRLSSHENILELQEVIFDKKSGTLALICELMDMNIYELIRGRRHYLQEQKIKNYMYQLCKSLEHMHRNGIFHRDIKPENILIRGEQLKLADFGSCRSIYSKQPYTEYISTRWYRAPECLLTDGYYTYKMDLWSVGCVFFEVLSLRPLFPGSNEVDQIAKIHETLGTPEPTVLNKLRNKTRGLNFNFPQKKGSGLERMLSHASPESVELIYQCCTYDPDDRITAKQALKHSYFKELRDAEIKKHRLAKLEQEKDEKNERRVSQVSTEPTTTTHISVIDPVQQSIQRRRRRVRRNYEDSNSNFHGGLLPKVNTGESGVNHSFNTFQKTGFHSSALPKIHAPSMLPSLANTHYNRHHHHPKKTTQYKPPTKNMYGHYQLPSITKSKGAGF